MAIRRRLETAAAVEFNSVLANLYRDGSDSNGWHADDEVELGDAPVIASVSFGQPRVFQMKHRTDKQQKFKLELPHGSVLMMRGETQKNWLHQIAKSRRSMTARINLTFRWVDPLLAKSASRT
jgi:alkylated DNA repair dioxygenase AlkB